MNEISIHDVAQKIKQIMNSKIEIKINNLKKRPINSEVDRLLCDNSFLKNNSKWEIKVNLEKGLRETIKWIKKNKKFFKAYNYNI